MVQVQVLPPLLRDARMRCLTHGRSQIPHGRRSATYYPPLGFVQVQLRLQPQAPPSMRLDQSSTLLGLLVYTLAALPAHELGALLHCTVRRRQRRSIPAFEVDGKRASVLPLLGARHYRPNYLRRRPLLCRAYPPQVLDLFCHRLRHRELRRLWQEVHRWRLGSRAQRGQQSQL